LAAPNHDPRIKNITEKNGVRVKKGDPPLRSKEKVVTKIEKRMVWLGGLEAKVVFGGRRKENSRKTRRKNRTKQDFCLRQAKGWI